MVNSEELIGTTEYLLLSMRCCINCGHNKQVQLTVYVCVHVCVCVCVCVVEDARFKDCSVIVC